MILKKRKHAALILEDSKIYTGFLIGREPKNLNTHHSSLGEIIFNTSMSGYQEVITDPSYKEQIVCFTYPSIGNYGINEDDHESDRPYLSGIVIRDYCEIPSNFQSRMSLKEFLYDHGLTGIYGVDTRALVRYIRSKGELKAGIFLSHDEGVSECDASEIKWFEKCLSQVCAFPKIEGRNLTSGFNGAYSQSLIESEKISKKRS